MILKVTGGCFTYPKSDREILRDVNFEACDGELVAILGPNGAGKTTLLRCITGMLGWTKGSCTLDGREVASISRRKLWREMAYVPQARGVVTSNTAEETVLLGRAAHFGTFSQPGRADIAAAREAMERLGIMRLRKKRCDEMSGGEFQMVLMARALASNPRILILDEPESNLDFKNQLLVMDTMSSLAAAGITCIFNTHYPAHALRRANNALLINSSGASIFGEVNAVLTESNISGAFGVRAFIGTIETPVSIVRDIIPLESAPAKGDFTVAENSGARTLATISVISQGNGSASKLNALLHEYRDYLIGRMGMPYPEGGVYIITVNVDAPEHIVKEMTHKISILPQVSVKTTYARGNFDGGDGSEQH